MPDIRRRKVFLLNDTYLQQRHFGCELVSSTFREQFARVGLEMIGSAPKLYSATKYAEKMQAADLIVLNAEGSIHHNRNSHLLEVAAKYPAVMVNGVFEDNEGIAPLLKNFLFISCRESLSASYIRDLGFQSAVTPDVIFSSIALRSYTKDPAPKELGLTDSVKSNKIRVGPFTRKREYGFTAERSFVDYFEELTSYRRLCIGRFHGVVAASVLGIPFSSWESNTWKIRGLMKDMNAEHLHFASQDEAVRHVPQVMPISVAEFAEEAVIRIDAMFDQIAEIAASV
jgi:hypothetical protein